jgi:release factor glutamine methyltransferase
VRQAFVEAASVLRQAGIETPELDARLLLCDAAGLTHEAYIARAGDELAPEVAARLGYQALDTGPLLHELGA